MALVELHRFYSSVEADIARLNLGSEGIEAFVFDSNTLYVGIATGIRLMVDEDDRAAALRIIAESGPQPM